ncbi:MAG: hypothetical protein JNM93_08840 [Bacteriovoracaceae bacterium]|nr:hypothetical protein [Bacteriovoracaceae bacterium]
MKFLILFLITTPAWSMFLYPAGTGKCPGAYIAKNQDGSNLRLDVYSSQGVLKTSYDKMETKLSFITDHLAKNMDILMLSTELCYGFYNDAQTTGDNALAMQTEGDVKYHLILGANFVNQIRYKADEYISQKLQRIKHGLEVSGLNKEAVEDFLFYHEFSHIVQYLHKPDLKAGTDKKRELHADCMAGFFITIDRHQHGMYFYDQASVEASSKIFAYGLGDLGIFEKGHHGTHDQRALATQVGQTLANNYKDYNPEKLSSKQISDKCLEVMNKTVELY